MHCDPSSPNGGRRHRMGMGTSYVAIKIKNEKERANGTPDRCTFCDDSMTFENLFVLGFCSSAIIVVFASLLQRSVLCQMVVRDEGKSERTVEL